MGCPPGAKAMGELKVGCIILAIVLEVLGAEWTSCAPAVGTCQRMCEYSQYRLHVATSSFS